jgi:hypothetical protein
MTANQALQLLHLHEKSVEQGWERPHRRKRRGETPEMHSERLRAMWAVEQRRAREDEAVARAARTERRRPQAETPAPPPPLPPLHLVTGWSKASGKPPHDPDVALFGGWRIKDMKKKMGEKGGG